MEKIKKGDFVELEYTGKLKVGDKIFDSTDEEIAKENNLHNKNMEYGPVTICIGEYNVIKGLDHKLEGREIGKEYEVDIEPEEGFGKKDPKLLRTVSRALFQKQNMNPYPGLQINADGMVGTVRSVNGGRIILDFNHPLAGRVLIYTVKVKSLVKDTEKQVKNLIKFGLFLNESNFKMEIVENNLKITTKIKIPEPFEKRFKEKVKELVPKIEKITFLEEKTK
ncbi:peptidylprolyl isomerase [archaeon]|nr:peptidylprolyl isomerase [archaeon]